MSGKLPDKPTKESSQAFVDAVEHELFRRRGRISDSNLSALVASLRKRPYGQTWDHGFIVAALVQCYDDLAEKRKALP